jgi:hypothetical protein
VAEHDLGIPAVATTWRDAGFGPKEADLLADGGMDPEQALKYRRHPRGD